MQAISIKHPSRSSSIKQNDDARTSRTIHKNHSSKNTQSTQTYNLSARKERWNNPQTSAQNENTVARALSWVKNHPGQVLTSALALSSGFGIGLAVGLAYNNDDSYEAFDGLKPPPYDTPTPHSSSRSTPWLPGFNPGSALVLHKGSALAKIADTTPNIHPYPTENIPLPTCSIKQKPQQSVQNDAIAPAFSKTRNASSYFSKHGAKQRDNTYPHDKATSGAQRRNLERTAVVRESQYSLAEAKTYPKLSNMEEIMQHLKEKELRRNASATNIGTGTWINRSLNRTHPELKLSTQIAPKDIISSLQKHNISRYAILDHLPKNITA